MKTVRIPAIVLTLLLIGFLVYIDYSAKLLPEKVATHFGASGQPNGWMSRTHYFWFQCALGIGLPLFFAVQILLIKRIPARFVNLPNKDYWLSPEHKEEYVSYMSAHLLWMSCLMLAFFAGLHYLIIHANNAKPVRLEMNKFLPVMIGFVAAVILWSLVIIFHFRKTDDTDV